MLNILSLAVAATAALHLKSADGELLYGDDARTLPARIILHSPGSKAYGIVESRQTARTVKRMNENEGKLVAATSEERIAETAEDLATITIAFENFDTGTPDLKGEALFAAVYSNPSLGFITKQVSKFLGDWGNFKNVSSAI